MKFYKTRLFKYSVGVLLLAPFVVYAGVDALKNLVTPIWGYIFLAFVFTTLVYWVDSFRWGIITNELTRRKVCTFREYFIIFTSAMCMGQFISSTGGMFVVRPVILRKKYDLPYRFSYIAMVVEKSADMFFLVVFLMNSVVFFSLKTRAS